MNTVTDNFGSMVFNDSVMRARLPKDVFRQVQRSMNEGSRLDSAAATVVANAMKDWAIEKGATHFSNWFQPMTGITAEKHESFLSPVGGGRVIMEFSGKELIQDRFRLFFRFGIDARENICGPCGCSCHKTHLTFGSLTIV